MDSLRRKTESGHQKRDWSDLSPDLLRLISIKLSDLFDFVRFRTVCKHWRSAAPASDHHPLLPCLFGRRSDRFLLYSITSDETHKINFPNQQGKINFSNPNFPEARHWTFTGPIEHHILAVTVGSVSLSFINPLTKNEVILPPINHNCFFPHTWTGLNCTETWEHVAVEGYEGNSSTQYLASYRHSKGRWATIEKDLTGRYPIGYYKGMYYCIITQTGVTEVIHATTGEIMSTILPPQLTDTYCSFNKHYFVESSGDLLLVCKFMNYSSRCFGSMEYYFDIFRLNQENDDPVWVQMSNISDRALFLGISSGFSVRATDFDRFKGNCIYSIEGALKHVKDSFPLLVNYLLRYDIEHRCWEELPYPFQEAVTWIMPSLH